MKDDPARGETYQRLLARNNRPHLEALGSYAGAPGNEKFSFYAYAATFAEVAVDARLGLVRLRRMVGAYDVGRIISPELADYLVPVNADIPADLNPIGVKGLGEIVVVGVPPAIANAVFNATGRRIRALPITPEALL